MKTNQKTLRQQEYVKESLTRAFDELKCAQRGEHKMMTDDEFMAELKAEGETKPHLYFFQCVVLVVAEDAAEEGLVAGFATGDGQ